MYGIDSIDLVFENCEVIKIDGKHIGNLLIGEIDTRIKRIAGNSFKKITTASKILIEVNRNANTKYSTFGEINKDTKFERICHYGDITSIEIYYEDYQKDGTYKPNGKSEIYYVDWVGDSEYTNEIQTACITPYGDLRLAIMKDYKESDYFEEYEDKDEEKSKMDYYWSVLNNIEN